MRLRWGGASPSACASAGSSCRQRGSPAEALLLEARLIHQLRARLNIAEPRKRQPNAHLDTDAPPEGMASRLKALEASWSPRIRHQEPPQRRALETTEGSTVGSTRAVESIGD